MIAYLGVPSFPLTLGAFFLVAQYIVLLNSALPWVEKTALLQQKTASPHQNLLPPLYTSSQK